MTWTFLDSEPPYGFAHRGGNTVAPENTLAAFHHATSLGYRYLETDVHLSSDGVLVAFHDQDLKRITGTEGAISDRSWDELAEIKIDGSHRIPTLQELFETFPDARFNIDPKANEAVEPLAKAIQANNAIDRVCVGAFSDKRISQMRNILGPRLCTSPGPASAMATIGSAYLPTKTQTFGHGCLQLPPKANKWEVTADLVERMHDAGMQIHVWTINNESEMHRLFDLGVDAIMTDDAPLLAKVLTERGHPL